MAKLSAIFCATDLAIYYSATEKNLQMQPEAHFSTEWEQNESPPGTFYDLITDTNFSQSSMTSFIHGLLQPVSSYELRMTAERHSEITGNILI
jgi:hypothetical protein